jgi:aryl-alcohol dehydrogenase-like predicted oxidoreductase
MAEFCRAHDIALLTYGTLLGGFLSDAYLGRDADLGTVSKQKYRQMIDAWGGWALFQDLLAALKRIADKHGASVATVGARMILDRPAVAGAIVGARLGIAEHIAENSRILDLALDTEDAASLDPVLARSSDLMRVIGDCGDEYR